MSIMLFFAMVKIMFILSIIFSACSHPMMMLLTLISMSLILAYIIFSISSLSWISFIFCLIIVGGVMILFIYMTSLSSNYSFLFNNMIFISMMTLLLCPKIPMNNNFKFKISNMEILFNSNFFSVLFYLIIYLFISLMIILELTASFKLPFRSQ